MAHIISNCETSREDRHLIHFPSFFFVETSNDIVHGFSYSKYDVFYHLLSSVFPSNFDERWILLNKNFVSFDVHFDRKTDLMVIFSKIPKEWISSESGTWQWLTGSKNLDFFSLVCPWHYVCHFSNKNIVRHELKNVPNKHFYFLVKRRS